MARPDTHPGVEGGGAEGGGDGSAGAGSPAADVVRPETGVVRPGTGVVRPGTGVVRPGSGGGTATDATTAKARAVVPDAPERPLEPIHVVLPVIPVMPAKQGFLDRLVAGKPKKTEADIAEEEAQKAEEEARKAAEEAQRAVDEARREQARAAAKADAEERKADAKAAEEARKAEAKAAEEAQKAEEKARRADEKVRRAEAKAREKAAEDEDEEEPVSPALPPRMEPPRAAPPAPPMAPPRPMPSPGRGSVGAPPRPGQRPGAPQRPMAPSRPQRDPRRQRQDYAYRGVSPRQSLGRWLAVVVALLALGTGSAVVTGQAAPPAPSQWVAGLKTGEAAPVLSGLNANAKRPSNAGLAGVVGPLLADPALGGRVSASIVDVASGDVLYDTSGGAAATPASTAKLLTATAVLATRGPTYQIATRVVAGAGPGEVVIIGGGDPTLAAGASPTYPGAARLDLLAEQVRKALGTTPPSRVTIDTSLYAGSTSGPGWCDCDLHSGYHAHVTALMTDGARTNPQQTSQTANRYWEPDVAAGQIFAQALGLPVEAAGYGTAPANAKQLGQVLSPPISRLVEIMLGESDNVIAEGLARQVALARKLPASFEGAAQATRAVLGELGISSDGLGLADGSGLSNANQVSAAQLTAVLAHAASPKYPQLRAIVSGLPVAGYSGTLASRYLNPATGGAGAGVVRAKTGTLTGVNALAGIAVDVDGRLIAFAMVADQVAGNINASNLALRALDRVAAAVASCGC